MQTRCRADLLRAWVLAGVAFGILLGRVGPLRRARFAAVAGLVLLLFASEASFALARNLRLSDVIDSVTPGIANPLLSGRTT